MFPAYQCECGERFNRVDYLIQHMRFMGCKVYWYNDQVWHEGLTRVVIGSKYGEDSEELYLENLYIKRIMADAKIAQDKRDLACKQAWPRS